MNQSAFNETLRLYFQELRHPTHYIVALGVGTLLTLIARMNISLPVAPFIVPFLVSSIGRTLARAADRKKEQLLELPAQRSAPGFVICRDGRIEAALGKTQRLFERLSVTCIQDFLVSPEQPDLIDSICGGRTVHPAPELFAPAVNSWYRVFTHSDPAQPSVLVWLEDISEERASHERRATMRQFQIDVLQEASGEHLEKQGDERLARLILDGGFQAVLFARQESGGTLVGTAFKVSPERQLSRSGSIRIDPESHAPILRSRSEGRAVAASRDHGRNDASFDSVYPVAPDVARFIGTRVDNLVNYHAGDTSIVAFNKKPALSRTDISFLEAAVDAAHSLFAAIDVATDRDLRFIQAIHGLCASAEFSDEITGSHIWRVNEYSALLAGVLCPDGPFCRNIGQVAAAHDIGKVAMPELVHAPRTLTNDEWMLMQLHTIYGAQILDRMIGLGEKVDPRLTLAHEIALNHHQRWDGKGYPGLVDARGVRTSLSHRNPAHYGSLRPLKEDEIPLSARVVSICDSYDALRSERPYKRGFNHATATALIVNDDRSQASGTERFGPDVFEAFMDVRDQFAQIFERELEPTVRGGCSAHRARILR